MNNVNYDINEIERRPETDGERLAQIEAQRNEKSSAKKTWFAGGILVGMLISLAISIGVYVFVGLNAQTVSLVGRDKTNTQAEQSVVNSKTMGKIRMLENSISEYYLGDISVEDLETGIYRGVVEALGDPYAGYYTAEELKELQMSSEGIYYGIGAYVGLDSQTQYCKITGIIPGTPAEEAGFKAEDLIVKVDGVETLGMTTTEVVELIKGEENTDVVVTVARTGETDYIDIKVTRKRVEAPTVTYEMLENKTAYIQISQFEEVTIGQFEDSLKQAREEGMESLIIDLRNNPGGTLSSVVGISRMLLPEGLIVYMEDKKGERKEYKCDGKNQLEVPLVVLVNENSASAAEILAGAIKDYEIGTLLGTTTFGKGIVQKVFGITDGSGLKLTISHYYTPKGNDIHEVGVEPNEVLELDVEKYLEEGTDNQLERAKEILSKER